MLSYLVDTSYPWDVIIASFESHNSNSRVIGTNFNGKYLSWLNNPHNGLKLTIFDLPAIIWGK